MRPPELICSETQLIIWLHPNVRLGTSKVGLGVSEPPSKGSGSLGPTRAERGSGRGADSGRYSMNCNLTEMQHCKKIKFRTMCWKTLDTSAQLS